MGTAITWLIAFFIVISTAFSAINGVMTSSRDRTEALANSDQRVIKELESSFSIVSAKQRQAQAN